VADEFADRKRLTFEQAEGAEPLPTQLELKELSPLLRSAIWAVIYEDMRASTFEGGLSDFWEIVAYDWHVYLKHRPVDEYIPSFSIWSEEFKRIFLIGSYTDVFGLLQRILRQDSPQIALRCSPELRKRISLALQIGHAAYRVLDGDTIVPLGSTVELETL
jgi:hypothetical protein